MTTPHPNAGKTCACKRGKASAYDGKCGNCRSSRERKAVEKMRQGWPPAAARRGYLVDDERLEMAVDALEDLD